MTHPLSIGSEVIITGPSTCGTKTQIGHKMEVSYIDNDDDGTKIYSSNHFFWYPASSLRLVGEELKIGDWVCRDLEKVIFKIDDIHTGRNETLCLDASSRTWYPAKRLRKLAPEEIAMHTGIIGYKMQEFQDATGKGMEAIRRLLAPIVDERFEETIERLSAIEKSMQDIVNRQGDQKGKLDGIERRLSNLGPSHADLMTDVEALAEKVGAIENHLAWVESKHDESIDRQADELHAMQKSIDVLEGIQRGEGPEVCEGRPDDPITVFIERGNVSRRINAKCNAEAASWAKKVLDSMREV